MTHRKREPGCEVRVLLVLMLVLVLLVSGLVLKMNGRGVDSVGHGIIHFYFTLMHLHKS